MKILFVTRHFGCLRNYARVIETLAAGGHQVHLAALQTDVLGGAQFVERLVDGHATLTADHAPVRGESVTEQLVVKIRLARDCLRYLQTAYADTPRLLGRAWERTPQGLQWLLRVPGMRSRPATRLLAAVLSRLERAAPPAMAVREYLTRHGPDVVLLTPLIGLGSPELDYLWEAKAVGLRTVFCVWSWDNLSSKALLRAVPEAVTVWNETQRREAVELHGIPANRVVVTGAQCFDHRFDRRPSRPREDFCDRIGLSADRPFILYVCSALFQGSPVEAEFVRTWVDEIRREPGLRDVGVLVRPHPSRRTEWERVPLRDLGEVALWGANPIDAVAQADYYDSLHYSAAVVGLNTSAFLEAGIVGRPTLTVRRPEFHENQEGTLHFKYLRSVGGGLLHVADDWPTHRAQLRTAIGDGAGHDPKSKRFVEAFLRPHGVDVSATGRFVEAVDSVARRPRPAPLPEISESAPSRVGYRVLERFATRGTNRRLFMDPAEAEKDRRRVARGEAQRLERETKHRAREEEWADKERRRADTMRQRATREQEHRLRKVAAKHDRIKAKERRKALQHRRSLRMRVAQRVKRLIGVTSPRG